MTLMLEGMAVIGIDVFISLGSYYLGNYYHGSAPTSRENILFFAGIVFGIFFIAIGVWRVIDGLS